MEERTKIFAWAFFGLFVIVAAFFILNGSGDPDVDFPINLDDLEIKQFNSLDEMQGYIEENQASGGYDRGLMEQTMGAGDSFGMEKSGDVSMEVALAEEYSNEHSETNIQVEGVDEADIVKNDGKYIYVLTGRKIVILNAYPAENMEIVSEINFTNYPSEFFINDDELVVFTNDYSYGEGENLVLVYDLGDKANPEIKNKYAMEGNYRDSRMIGDFVYVISNKYIYGGNPMPPIYRINGIENEIAVDSISYFPGYDTSYTFTIISAINLENGEIENKVFLLGSQNTLYMSENNIYLTQTKYKDDRNFYELLVEKVFMELLPSKISREVQDILDIKDKYYNKYGKIQEIISMYSENLIGNEKEEFDRELMEKTEEFSVEFYKNSEQTIIHKISVDGLEIKHKGIGKVPGRILNQFSMDEYGGYFRIAVTSGQSWRSNQQSMNHLFVLDDDLEIVGSVEDLAKGERIYSVRFMGERAYMVTFKQVDPLFVIDLGSPTNPEVLGYLKVTGYSSYLHPYDENHVIGIGKEGTETGQILGVKIALFDVSDVENPIEKAKYTVEGKWSNSEALYEHKAFLFDREKELLTLPMSYTIETDEKNRWGGYVNKQWTGIYVFHITQNNIKLQGEITHQQNESEEWTNWKERITRSLYMDDVLYTVSQMFVYANSLDNLNLIKSVEIGEDEEYDYYLKGGFVGEPIEEIDFDE